MTGVEKDKFQWLTIVCMLIAMLASYYVGMQMTTTTPPPDTVLPARTEFPRTSICNIDCGVMTQPNLKNPPRNI